MIFSIIVPIYGVERYLHKCVDSILAQTFTDFELILVDDGSPDNCPKICDEYKDKDSRVHVIHKPNEGLVAARNTGIDAAKGKYICYVDGDDWVSPILLETVWNKVLSKMAVDMVVYQGVRQFVNKQVPLPEGPEEGLYEKKRLKKDVYPYMMYDCRKPFCHGLVFPVAWNKVFQRELLVKHRCKEKRIRMGEDNAFVFECLYASNNVFFINDSLYYYNQLNAGSMTNNYDPNRFENNRYMIDYMERNMGGKDPIIDNQLNAFKAYWLMMAVFHEIKCGRPLKLARGHIAKSIKKNHSTEDIVLKGLPKSAQIFIALLKNKQYMLTLVLAYLVTKLRDE